MIPMIHKKKKSVQRDKHGVVIADYRKENRDTNQIAAKILRVMRRRAKKGYSCTMAPVLQLLPGHMRKGYANKSGRCYRRETV
jgi:hypothetical protein